MKKTTWSILLFGILIGPGLLAASPESPAKPKRPVKHKLGRAMIEGWSLMAISGVNYQIKYTKFIEDWQFEWNWNDQGTRFFSSAGSRLDSNAFKSNWTHGLSGAIYYNLARTNGLGWGTSSLFSLGGSLFWEYICEWREVISINDNIITSFGGPAIGEALFQFSRFYQERGGTANKIIGLLIDPFLGLNNILDKRFFGRGRATSEAWHDSRLYLGRQEGQQTTPGDRNSNWNLTLNLSLVNLPGYGQGGERSGFHRDTYASAIDFEIDAGSQGVEEFSARSQSMLFGYAKQKVQEDERGGLHGHAFSIGAASAFQVMKKRALVDYDGPSGTLSDPRFPRPRPTQFTDKLGVISLLGPILDYTHFAGPFCLHFTCAALFDIALVNSLPLNDYSVDHDLSNVKTTLLSWGYYYGYGYTLSPELTLAYGPFELRGLLRYQNYRSIQGLDRFQDIVSDDFSLSDSRRLLRLGLGYRLPRLPLRARLCLESIGRWGRILDLESRTTETRFYYQVGIDF